MSARPKIKGPAHADSVQQAAEAFAELDKRLRWNDLQKTRPAPAGAQYSPEEMMGLELRRYLTKIYNERKRQGLAIGNLDGWARSLSIVSARADGRVTLHSVSRHCERVGIVLTDDILSPIVAEVAAAKAAGVLSYTPRLLGEMLQLTAAEREEYAISRLIDACDETKLERDRRRKAKARAASGSTPRSLSASSTQPWIADGFKSRRTWERNGKRPKMAQIRPSTIDIHKEEECADEFTTNGRCADEFATNGEGEDG